MKDTEIRRPENLVPSKNPQENGPCKEILPIHLSKEQEEARKSIRLIRRLKGTFEADKDVTVAFLEGYIVGCSEVERWERF